MTGPDAILGIGIAAVAGATITAITVLSSRHTMTLLDRLGHPAPAPTFTRVPQDRPSNPDGSALLAAMETWEAAARDAANAR